MTVPAIVELVAYAIIGLACFLVAGGAIFLAALSAYERVGDWWLEKTVARRSASGK